VGYGLQFNKDNNGEDIIANTVYCYEHELGFTKCTENKQHTLSGSSLLALHNNDLTDTKALTDAKKLMRRVFNQLLNGKPLKSRELFT